MEVKLKNESKHSQFSENEVARKTNALIHFSAFFGFDIYHDMDGKDPYNSKIR